jgi:phage baseplate assembly protein W|nr:MAG TPA: baseplate assembly protein [Caudoviricetes sp.]
MANYNQLNSIGSGAYFPIKLEQAVGSDGKLESVQLPDGRVVPKIGWYILRGDVALIKQNLTAILTYQIGQRFRQEDFGSRTWECLEEPNTSALNLMIKNFVKDGIAAWEPRITALKVLALKPTKESIRLLIYFKVQDSQRIEELNFQYNLNNSTTDVY